MNRTMLWLIACIATVLLALAVRVLINHTAPIELGNTTLSLPAHPAPAPPDQPALATTNEVSTSTHDSPNSEPLFIPNIIPEATDQRSALVVLAETTSGHMSRNEVYNAIERARTDPGTYEALLEMQQSSNHFIRLAAEFLLLEICDATTNVIEYQLARTDPVGGGMTYDWLLTIGRTNDAVTFAAAFARHLASMPETDRLRFLDRPKARMMMTGPKKPAIVAILDLDQHALPFVTAMARADDLVLGECVKSLIDRTTSETRRLNLIAIFGTLTPTSSNPLLTTVVKDPHQSLRVRSAACHSLMIHVHSAQEAEVLQARLQLQAYDPMKAELDALVAEHATPGAAPSSEASSTMGTATP